MVSVPLRRECGCGGERHRAARDAEGGRKRHDGGRRERKREETGKGGNCEGWRTKGGLMKQRKAFSYAEVRRERRGMSERSRAGERSH